MPKSPLLGENYTPHKLKSQEKIQNLFFIFSIPKSPKIWYD